MNDQQLKSQNRLYRIAAAYGLRAAVRHGHLRTREADMLEARMGLGGQEPSTLDRLADDYDVSVERVRQITERGLKRMMNAEKIDIEEAKGHD